MENSENNVQQTSDRVHSNPAVPRPIKENERSYTDLFKKVGDKWNCEEHPYARCYYIIARLENDELVVCHASGGLENATSPAEEENVEHERYTQNFESSGERNNSRTLSLDSGLDISSLTNSSLNTSTNTSNEQIPLFSSFEEDSLDTPNRSN